jgi:glycosyltransferase involved in cell wall biosynthesis
MKRKILIINPYFFPGFKAGGPVQSLVNLIELFGDTYQFFVVTSAYDLNESAIYEGISTDQWLNITLRHNTLSVWYASKALRISDWKYIYEHVEPDIVYINGIYGWSFFLAPIFLKNSFPRTRFVISPRGMLQAGALSVKPLKKKLYFSLLKLSGLLKGVSWHATNEEEKSDIIRLVNAPASIYIAGNIPKQPASFKKSYKKPDALRLLYVSLITEKKNVLLLISVLAECKASITLDIYGPVKDGSYWSACQKLTLTLPPNITVTYKGDIQPAQVQETISGYDALVLLTKGENFGHALFESFSVGRPVITSNFTPWNELQQKNAGWNVDIANPTHISSLFDKLASTDAMEWDIYCEGAHKVATRFFEESHFEESYLNLFS